MTTEIDTTAEPDAPSDEVDHEAEPAQQRPKFPRRLVRRITLTRRRFRLFPTLLMLLVVVAAACSAVTYFSQYRPDQQIGTDDARAALDAATSGSIAVLSYSPDTLDKDFATAKSHLTGEFLTYYSQFTQQIVTPAVKQKGVKTTASVIRAAVSELAPTKAVVLLYINQLTMSTDRAEPAQAESSVLVTLVKVNDNWLISEFNPI